jgi:PhnB protein
MPVKPIPDGYHSVTPYLMIDGCAAAIDYYKRVFGATERMRMPADDGKIGHAELEIGDSVVMMADEDARLGYRSPKAIGGSPVMIMLYVEDVDARFAAAVAAGAKVRQPVEDKFYGDRTGALEDPFGHVWVVSTHTEDLTPEEMGQRAAAAAKSPA